MMETRTRTLWGLMLAGATLAALPAAAQAQETQRSDTAATTDHRTQDTTSVGRAQVDATGHDSTRWGYPSDSNPDVQNPPGYRGMERPTNVFPPDSGKDSPSAGAVEDRTTGSYDRNTWNDSTADVQNPAGYRGMERPVGGASGDAGQQEIERYRQRLGEMGYKVEKMTKAEKKAWKEAHGAHRTTGTGDGGAGVENAAGRDTTMVGETSPKSPRDSTRRLPSARGDTTGQSSGTSDTSSDTGSDGSR